MNKFNNKPIVSVLLRGEPFLFVIFMFLSALGVDILSEQIGQKIPFVIFLILSVILSSGLMTIIYPVPVWWLALTRYILSGLVAFFFVKWVFDDLIIQNSFTKAIIGAGLDQIWTITKDVPFPVVIFTGLFACFLSLFWIVIIGVLLVGLIMIIAVILFGLINTLMLIWFKPIFDSYNLKEIEKIKPDAETKDRSKTVALVLCALGLFTCVHGMHRIYTRRYFTGIMQLITFGGLYLWTFIDLILILSGNFIKKDTENNSDILDSHI